MGENSQKAGDSRADTVSGSTPVASAETSLGGPGTTEERRGPRIPRVGVTMSWGGQSASGIFVPWGSQTLRNIRAMS